MKVSIYLLNKRSIVATVLSCVLILLQGCAAGVAQRQIDTVKENAFAIQKASEFIRLDRIERDSKCRNAEATFTKVNLSPEYRSSAPMLPDSQLQPVLEYTRHAYIVQKYMDEKKVTAEAALTVMGDLLLPSVLTPEIDPFKGCVFDLGRPLDKPAASQGGKLADSFVFYWQSRDWRETNQAAIKLFGKFLPSENRTPFDHFLLDYSMTLSKTLMERREIGEITLLQWLRAGNAGGVFLIEQARQYGAQLRENLVRAKAKDDALLEAVAVGLGTVATAALVVSAVSANYRIANAQTSIANSVRLQAQQAQAPIVCNYTLPARYGTPGYIYCR